MESRYGGVIYLSSNNTFTCEKIYSNLLIANKEGSFIYSYENNIVKVYETEFTNT